MALAVDTAPARSGITPEPLPLSGSSGTCPACKQPGLHYFQGDRGWAVVHPGGDRGYGLRHPGRAYLCRVPVLMTTELVSLMESAKAAADQAAAGPQPIPAPTTPEVTA